MKSVGITAKSVASIDWLTFTVKMEVDPRAVIKKYLRMDEDLFELQAWGKFGYRQSLQFDGVVVFFDPAEHRKMEMGVCVSMSGKGCRTFERFTTWKPVEEGGTPFIEFLSAAHVDDMVHFTRIDLALDDKDGYLDLDTIVNHVETDQINSRIRHRTFYKSYIGAGRSGTTVYIGASASDFRIRFYDKAKEHFKPDQPEYNSHWVRCEIVMRGQNANGCVAALSNTENLGFLASSILKDKLNFIVRDNDNISRCTVCDWWLLFVGKVAGIKLVQKEDVPDKLERCLEWVTTQVAPTLSLIFEAKGFFKIREILEIGEEKRSLKQQALLREYFKNAMVSRYAEKVDVE